MTKKSQTCDGCGAPVATAECAYCGRKPEIRTARRVVTANMGKFTVLEDVDLLGNMNQIATARRCKIVGNMNKIDVAVDCEIVGNMNKVRKEQ